MNMHFVKRLTVSTALVFAFTLTSQAKPGAGEKPADGERRHRPHMTPEKRAKILEKFDANDNGKLDPDEKAKARAAMKKRHEGHDHKKGPGKKECPKKGVGNADDAT